MDGWGGMEAAMVCSNRVSLWFNSFITTVFLALAACNSGSGAIRALSANCEAKVRQGALDEGCAIEIAKDEVTTKKAGGPYETYEAWYDKDRKTWKITAYDELGPPDSHRNIEINLRGEVVDFGSW
jgi:hypothetical protein